MHLDGHIQKHPTWKKHDELICNLLLFDRRNPLSVLDEKERGELIESIVWLNWQIAYLTEAIGAWTGDQYKWDFEEQYVVENEEYER